MIYCCVLMFEEQYLLPYLVANILKEPVNYPKAFIIAAALNVKMVKNIQVIKFTCRFYINEICMKH